MRFRLSSLSHDELSACLMVNRGDVISLMDRHVSCVRCRKTVQAMLEQELGKDGGRFKSALQPLVISEEGVIGISWDHAQVNHDF